MAQVGRELTRQRGGALDVTDILHVLVRIDFICKFAASVYSPQATA
jgi:hypothetical protein